MNDELAPLLESPWSPPAAPPADGATWLGPAVVVAAQPTLVVDKEGGDRAHVTPAFTFPYAPEPGDVLLVLACGGRHWAVGVLSGRGPTVLAFHGRTEVRAIGGELALASDRAIVIDAPRVTVKAGLLRTLADQVVEKADHVRRWVKGLCALRAGSSRRIVDGQDSTRCNESITLAKDTVKLDASQLHLGH